MDVQTRDELFQALATEGGAIICLGSDLLTGLRLHSLTAHGFPETSDRWLRENRVAFIRLDKVPANHRSRMPEEQDDSLPGFGDAGALLQALLVQGGVILHGPAGPYHARKLPIDHPAF